MANRPNAGPDAAAVARAFQMATGLPTSERVRLRVGVLSGDGTMIASGVLRGFEQAGFLRDQLQIVGFAEFVPSRPADTLGCDLLLKHVRDTEGQPPDLLRPEGSLWPPPHRPRGTPRPT
jgi:hypothetical protein